MSNEEVVEKVLKCLHCGYEWVEEALDIQCPNCYRFDETGELFIELDKKWTLTAEQFEEICRKYGGEKRGHRWRISYYWFQPPKHSDVGAHYIKGERSCYISRNAGGGS